jgi:hypothetical protein
LLRIDRSLEQYGQDGVGVKSDWREEFVEAIG